MDANKKVCETSEKANLEMLSTPHPNISSSVRQLILSLFASSVDLQPHDSPGLTTSYHFPYPRQPPVPDKVLAPTLATIIGLSAAIAAFDDRDVRLAPRPKPDL